MCDLTKNPEQRASANYTYIENSNYTCTNPKDEESSQQQVYYYIVISVAIFLIIVIGGILAYLLFKRKFCCQDSAVDDQFIELALPCERQSLERKNTPKVYDTEWIKTLKKK